jgi:hypothetical protein
MGTMGPDGPPSNGVPRLIDPQTGIARLRVVADPPEPVRKGFWDWLRKPQVDDDLDVELKGGMSPQEVGPPGLLVPNSDLHDVSWWRWRNASTQTSVGEVRWPVVFFRSHRLICLKLHPPVAAEPRGFLAVEQKLEALLGPAHEVNDGGYVDGSGPVVTEAPYHRPPWKGWSRRWFYAWGSVSLCFEWRDWSVETIIEWTDPA